MTTLPFEIIRAFADSSSSGNPAAVVLLPPTSAAESATTDPSSLKALFPPDVNLQATATLADQPMTAFALPLSTEPEEGIQKFALRWFNPKTEAWLCGHATMATSAILFSQSQSLKRVEYISQKYGTLVAHRGNSGGLGVEVSMDFPELTEMAVMPETEMGDLLGLIGGATQGWDRSAVLEVWDSPDRTLVELKGDYDLAKLEVDCHKLASLAPKTIMFTQVIDASKEVKEQIRSRVLVIVPGYEHEDVVTGSAHCLIIPYFLTQPSAHKRLDSATPTKVDEDGNVIINARQVSSTGGDVQVSWRKSERTVRITGRCLGEMLER